MSQSPNLTGYTLTYDDEFSSASAFKWSPDGSAGYQTTPYFGGRTLSSNGELSMYSDSTVGVDPFDVSNGALHITAAPGSNAYNLPYNTGMISTEGNFNQQWGYFEVRAEVAQGPGMWSAFYLLPTDKAWPPEVDAVEAFGANNPQYGGGSDQAYHGTIAPARDTQSGGGWATVPGDIWTGYHTYGVDVEPDNITWYFDGQPVSNVTQVKTPDGYDVPFYMVVALAVGGWSGTPTGETGVYNIDYIRAYSKNPNAVPTDFQAMSSPDGADTSIGGVTTASNAALTPTTITIHASEDPLPWVDAAFVVTVDGIQVGPMQTTSALHANGAWDTITIDANLRNAPHDVGITFVNDSFVSDTQDRNLYIDSVALNGNIIANSAAAIRSNMTVHFDQPGAGTVPPPPTGDGNLSVRVSEDAFNGDAQFIVTVDGVQVGGTMTATASHAAGQWQDIGLPGTFAAGAHTVALTFLNDAWGGSAATDRNLYVQSVTINGDTVPFTAAHNDASNGQTAPDGAVLAIDGTVSFTDTPSSPPSGGGTGGTGTGPLTLHVSEDAFNGDAQFTVTVDGTQFGGTQTVTASHAAGQWQDIAIAGTLAAGPHTIGVNFVNDAWGGTAATDRNMYVQSITVNGETLQGPSAQNTAANGGQASDPSAAVMDVNGTATFHSTGSSSSGTVAPSTIVFHVSEDAWNGDAQFQVMVDGNAVGGVQTATASHAAGQVQDITLSGDFGAQGPGHVDVVFLNDAWGGTAATDRNLYVQSIDVNGVHLAGSSAVNNAANHEEALDPSAAVMAIDGTADFNLNHTAPPQIIG
jgi:beta-glucanase (GH16 family)